MVGLFLSPAPSLHLTRILAHPTVSIPGARRTHMKAKGQAQGPQTSEACFQYWNRLHRTLHREVWGGNLILQL